MSNYKKSYNSGGKNSKYSEIEKLAYRLGQIDRGKKNPDTKVYDSYQNGLNGKSNKDKPLF